MKMIESCIYGLFGATFGVLVYDILGNYILFPFICMVIAIGLIVYRIIPKKEIK